MPNRNPLIGQARGRKRGFLHTRLSINLPIMENACRLPYMQQARCNPGSELMAEVLRASIRDQLWHRMRQDLAKFVPEINGNELLMCCTCGRFLPRECFDLEHLIPQQALKKDPDVVRTNPTTPTNIRARNLLLCKKRLTLNGNVFYQNGCNSWKGRSYDKPISELISTKALEPKNCSDVHIIAVLSLAYLAMVAEFGYVVALMRSGLLLREQFFRTRKYHVALPLKSQMLLAGGTVTSFDAPIWTEPFSFGFQRPGFCTVAARNFGIMVPISRDPREPFAIHLPIVPAKYKLRPDFRTVFD